MLILALLTSISSRALTSKLRVQCSQCSHSIRFTSFEINSTTITTKNMETSSITKNKENCEDDGGERATKIKFNYCSHFNFNLKGRVASRESSDKIERKCEKWKWKFFFAERETFSTFSLFLFHSFMCMSCFCATISK